MYFFHPPSLAIFCRAFLEPILKLSTDHADFVGKRSPVAHAPYLTSAIAIAATIIATIIAIAATRRSDVENGLRIALFIESSYAVLSWFSVIIIYAW